MLYLIHLNKNGLCYKTHYKIEYKILYILLNMVYILRTRQILLLNDGSFKIFGKIPNIKLSLTLLYFQ